MKNLLYLLIVLSVVYNCGSDYEDPALPALEDDYGDWAKSEFEDDNGDLILDDDFDDLSLDDDFDDDNGDLILMMILMTYHWMMILMMQIMGLDYQGTQIFYLRSTIRLCLKKSVMMISNNPFSFGG